MRECKKFQDLILSDYLDNQLDHKSQKEVEAHLVLCGECRHFAKKVKEKLSLPLRQAKDEPVPADLWPEIKKRINKEPKGFPALEGLLDLLYSPFFSRRLVPVMAGVIVAFLAGSMFFNVHQKRIAKENEQENYLVGLFDASGSQEYVQAGGFANTLEEYFL